MVNKTFIDSIDHYGYIEFIFIMDRVHFVKMLQEEDDDKLIIEEQ